MISFLKLLFSKDRFIKMMKDERGFLQFLAPIGAALAGAAGSGAGQAAISAGTSFGLSKLLGKKNKVPQQEYRPFNLPSQESLYFTPTLRQFASKRLAGQDLGFGDNFTGLANPAIAQRKARFLGETLPFLGSELSKRGVSRSAGPGLATDIIGRAEQGTQRDIDELLSRFTILNEEQKKRDLREGLDVATGLQEQESDINLRRALGESGLNEFNLNRERTQTAGLPEQNRLLGSKIGLFSDILGENPQIKGLIDKVLGGQGNTSKVLLPDMSEEKASLLDKQTLEKYLDQYFGGK